MSARDQQPDNFLTRFGSVNTFIFDMDGVLTDGSLLVMDPDYASGSNNWYRKMHVRDGYALQLAAKLGYQIAVISGSGSTAVKDRLNKLGIEHVCFDVKAKREFLMQMFSEKDWDFNTALCMGDDIPDLPAMMLCALRTCPADAAPEVRRVADYVSPFKGGEGCVRDVISMVLTLQGKWNQQPEVPST